MTKRVVFDTNILISGYLWGGIPRKALEKTWTKEWILVLSEDGIREFIRVLSYSKFALTASVIQPLITDLEENAEFVEVKSSVEIIKVVSGDSHLLNLKRYKDIEIITAKQFTEIKEK
ncbi:MAG: putative toxin-antitoxin system toxin component, PIN family [Deltaproteobacteria bacterium]|nr:putative toxin-antitoxin system toxin component, PIN family [Deltaproteobacteria bacterium]